MASTRTWSFTKLWAAIATMWLLAAGAFAAGTDVGALRLVALGLALLPAFMAGSWAGHHAELREWPKVRLLAMWSVLVFAVLAVDGERGSWKIAVILAAPIAILTVRWLELRGRPSPEVAVELRTPIPGAKTE